MFRAACCVFALVAVVPVSALLSNGAGTTTAKLRAKSFGVQSFGISHVNHRSPRRVFTLSGGVSDDTPAKVALSNPHPLQLSLDLTRQQALVLLLVISGIYGSNYAAIKTMDVAGMDPFYSTIVRFAVAASVFIPAIFKVAHKQKRGDIIRGGVEIGLLNGFGYLFQAVSLEQADSVASTVAFIASLACVVVPLLDFVIPALRKENLPPFSIQRFIPSILALVGVAILELYGVGPFLSQPGGTPGPVFSLSFATAAMQPLFFGLALWRLERLIKRCSTAEHQAAFTGANLIAVLLVAVAFFTISTLTTASALAGPMGVDLGEGGEQLALIPPPSVIAILLKRIADQRILLQEPVILGALLWTGFVTTAAATLLETFAVKKLTAAEVSIIYTTEPLWGTAIAWLLLREPVGTNTWVGGVFITFACVMSGMAKRNANPEPQGR